MTKRLLCLGLLFLLLMLTACADAGASVELSKNDRETISLAETDVPDWMPVLTVSAFVYDADSGDRTLTPLVQDNIYEVHVGGGGSNIELEFACEGYVIEVTGEDKLLELSVGSKNFGPWNSGDPHESRTFGFTQQVTSDGFISVVPIFCGWGDHYDFSEVVDAWGTMACANERLCKSMSYPGKELYLSVNVYELKNVNAPILFARLRLTQLEDPDSTEEYESSRFNISLIEYELSDKYKMMIE